jgi:hypothetical protein
MLLLDAGSNLARGILRVRQTPPSRMKWPAAANAALQPGNQVTRRLREVVVRSAGEAPHPVGVARPAAQHDHWYVGIDARREPVRGSDAVEQGEAAAVVEQEVEHHEREGWRTSIARSPSPARSRLRSESCQRPGCRAGTSEPARRPPPPRIRRCSSTPGRRTAAQNLAPVAAGLGECSPELVMAA